MCADVIAHPECPNYVGDALSGAVDTITNEAGLDTEQFARHLMAASVEDWIKSGSTEARPALKLA